MDHLLRTGIIIGVQARRGGGGELGATVHPNSGQHRVFGWKRNLKGKIFSILNCSRDSGCLCALGNICHSETPDKESFFALLNFTKSRARFCTPLK